MLLDTRRFIPPLHKPPKLHDDTLLMSFRHYRHIKKVYDEIIGFNDIDHFSINVVNTKGEMSIISYSPSIIYTIFQDGSYIYNGSISPTYYEKLDFYTWDQCYDRRFFDEAKTSLQLKNGIETGVVLIQRQLGFNILFSFATKRKNNELLADIAENSRKFIKMGFHCFNEVKEIYSQSYNDNNVLLISEPNTIKPMFSIPNLHIVK